ncbi:hypothetical protein [Inquilinus sp.]|uniref:hypothetical protein n=1 Tax=Inquilinus sp. TaxID=1932117 RepID=UPI0031D5A3CF
MATEINTAIFDELERKLGDQSIIVVNLLRYRETAEYGDGDERPHCTGREAFFDRYVPAFNAVTQGQDIGAQWIGTVQAVLAGPAGEAWDDVALVRYPNFAAFRANFESDAYRRNADPHRRAALADFRLLATTQVLNRGEDGQ